LPLKAATLVWQNIFYIPGRISAKLCCTLMKIV
jgi:hypothetical protein